MVDDNTQPEEGAEPELPFAPEPEQKIFGNDEPEKGPVDVSLEDGVEPQAVSEEPEQKAEPEAAPPPKPKNRVPSRDRINQLTHEVGNRDRQIAELQRQLNEMQGRTEELVYRNQEADAVAFDAHDKHWHAEEDAATEALKAAHAKQARGEDATDDIARATRRLSKAASETQAIGAFKANHPQAFNADGSRKAVEQVQRPAPPPPRVEQPRVEQQQPLEHIPEEIVNWFQTNPWANPNTEHYDTEMVGAMNQFTTILDARFKRSGRGNEIGSTTYLGELDNMLQNEFPEAYEDRQQQPPQRQQEQRRPTMTRPNGAGVAPASRQAQAVPTQGQPGSKTVRLSAEEQDMASKMNYTYPINHPKVVAGAAKAGARMPEADALRYHADFIGQDRARQAALGKS